MGGKLKSLIIVRLIGAISVLPVVYAQHYTNTSDLAQPIENFQLVALILVMLAVLWLITQHMGKK